MVRCNIVMTFRYDLAYVARLILLYSSRKKSSRIIHRSIDSNNIGLRERLALCVQGSILAT